MNRTACFFRVLLSLSVAALAPGLAPYQAAAQTMSAARIALPGVSAGAAGASINALGSSAILLPAANLQTGLIPTLTPAAALTPVLAAPLAVARAESVAPVVPAVAIEAARAAPTRALPALQGGAATLSAASKSGNQDAPKAALDGMFEASEARPEALAVSVQSAPSDSPRLEKPGERGPPTGPAPVPSTSLKRTFAVGFLGAIVPIALTIGAVIIAQLLGYHLHPNYQGPASASPSVLQALAIWVGAAIMAPVSEEAIFRGGLQGRLAKLAKRIGINDFIVPALITSAIFVVLHETSDPLLITTRLVHAMILSYVYKKEGIMASMAAHGFFNGLLAVGFVVAAAGVPWLALATLPLSAFFGWRAFKFLKTQKGDIASGAIAPKPLSGMVALAMAAVLMLGYVFIMPNIFWPLGAIALAINGYRKLKSGK